MTTREAIRKCVEVAGGATELSRKVGVAYKTIMDWKSGRTGISITNCLKIEKAVEGKVTRQEILPDYPWDETKIDDNKELEIAKNLLKMGMTKEDISKATGLSIEEIKNIKS